MVPERTDLARDIAPDAIGQRSIVEKRHVLGPRQADHDPQTRLRRFIQHRQRGWCVDAHRVGAGAGHRGEVASHLSQRRKLTAAVVGRERAIGHAFDQKPIVSCLEEFPVDEDSWHV